MNGRSIWFEMEGICMGGSDILWDVDQMLKTRYRCCLVHFVEILDDMSCISKAILRIDYSCGNLKYRI